MYIYINIYIFIRRSLCGATTALDCKSGPDYAPTMRQLCANFAPTLRQGRRPPSGWPCSKEISIFNTAADPVVKKYQF